MVALNFDANDPAANTEGLVDYLVVVSAQRGVDMSRLSRVDGAEVFINDTSLYNKRLPPQPSKVSAQHHVEDVVMGDHTRKPVLTRDMLLQVMQVTSSRPECVVDKTASRKAVVSKVFSIRASTQDGNLAPDFMISPGSGDVYPGPVIDEVTLRNQMYNDMAYVQIQRGISSREDITPQTIREAVRVYNDNTAKNFDQYTRGAITMADRFNAQADAIEAQHGNAVKVQHGDVAKTQRETQDKTQGQISLPGVGDDGEKQPKNTVADRIANMHTRTQERRLKKEAESQGQQMLF
jgi:flagellar basal body rod protein FlgC